VEITGAMIDLGNAGGGGGGKRLANGEFQLTAAKICDGLARVRGQFGNICRWSGGNAAVISHNRFVVRAHRTTKNRRPTGRAVGV